MAKPVNGKVYGIINNHIGKTYTFDRCDNGELVWSTDYDIYGKREKSLWRIII
jgi:hypothetical protein